MKISAKIEKIRLYPYSANITRSIYKELKSGINRIEITGLETSIITQTIRITSENQITVRDVSFYTEYKRIEELEKEPGKEKRAELLELYSEKKKLEAELKSVNEMLDSISNAKKVALLTSISKAFSQDHSEKKTEKLLKYLDKLEKRQIDKKTELENKIRELDSEIEIIKRKYGDLKDLVETGTIKLTINSPTTQKTRIYIDYQVSEVGWIPSYDLVVGENANLKMFAQINQNTGASWYNALIELVNKPIRMAKLTKIRPWYIETKEHELVKAKRAMKKAAPKPLMPTIAEAAPYEEAEITSGEVQVFKLKEPVDIRDGEQKTIFLKDIDIESKDYYVWTAAAGDDVVRVLKFANKDLDLLPGECRIFVEEKFVGLTRIPYMQRGEKIELPIVQEEKIKAKKELVDREDKKTGIMKGKAFVRYTYRLTIENLKESEVKIKIIDQIPVSRDPDIEVELEEENLTHKPDKVEMGIMTWKIKIRPKAKIKIGYTFTVKFPPEKEPQNLP